MDIIKGKANELILALKKYTSIIIPIKGSPDPDVLASAIALQFICEKNDIKTLILASKKLSLFQNNEFVRLLDIPVKFDKSYDNFHKFDAYAILDHQSAVLENIRNPLPCVVHMDHHEIQKEEIQVDFKLTIPESGSTSTLLSLLLQELDYTEPSEQIIRIATALMFGIKTDTDKYDFAGKMDYEALNFLAKFADSKIVNKLSGMEFSKETVRLLGKAVQNEIIYKDWLISHLEILKETERDNIAIIADFLLKKEHVNTAVVFAIIEGEGKRNLYLDVSLRTSDEKLDLNAIIKNITSQGGARKFKGAYQINLDYFLHSEDKGKLWEITRDTTVDVLKKIRDSKLKVEIGGILKRISRRLFKKFSD
jgi:nanoRNase/pAp phosphatase (c-di-AMP/oligoRNAs hydrolase)